jgi:hypothetical protein
MGPLSPRQIIGGVLRMRFRALCIQAGQGKPLEIRRGKEPAIVHVNGVGGIVPVRDTDPGTDLPLVTLILDDIGTDSDIKGPMFVWRPLESRIPVATR